MRGGSQLPCAVVPAAGRDNQLPGSPQGTLLWTQLWASAEVGLGWAVQLKCGWGRAQGPLMSLSTSAL